MATVYLAQELKHDRNVAIKVLKVATGLGTWDMGLDEPKSHVSRPMAFLYYVMPDIEGETLRANYDVAPDGQQFVLLKSTSTEARLLVAHNGKAQLAERLTQTVKQ